MQKFSVTILGSNSALPAAKRNPTAQVLNINSHYYLIDCGEGTQMQFRRYRLKMQRIKVIFISHLHGDHYFGLLGLLNSLHLLGRKSEITIVCPSMLKKIIEIQIKAAGGRLAYPIKYAFTDEAYKTKNALEVYRDKQLSVKAFPLKHRIPCTGFKFEEILEEYKYLPERGQQFGVKKHEIAILKSGRDVERMDGEVVRFKDVTIPPPAPRSYVFCTDTKPLDTTTIFAAKANLLYHEATFLEEDAVRAKATFHSTANQAATIALKSEVSKLLIGHFSARYSALDPLLEEAKAVFEPTELATEGSEFEII